MKPILAIFDFDGTITRRDTFILFLYFSCRKSYFWHKIPKMMSIFLLYKLHIFTNQQAKEKILALFCKKWTKQYFQKKGIQFIHSLPADEFRHAAMKCLEDHISAGNRVIVVSASPEEWIAPFAQNWGIEYIATKLEYDAQGFTGYIKGKNCYGTEKVRRIKEKFPNLNTYSVYCYGDSKGDIPMLSLAEKAFYQVF